VIKIGGQDHLRQACTTYGPRAGMRTAWAFLGAREQCAP